jgi:squalene synthase HpnC
MTDTSNPIQKYTDLDLDKAYSKAIKFAKDHYENFPVVSFLVPANFKKHVAIIYWFARSADDLADEGKYTVDERLSKLDMFETRLTELLKGNYRNSYEYVLNSTIRSKKLTSDLFYNLIKAFKQDVTKKRYVSFNELLNYCENSANPIGRLILELNNIRSDKAFYYSDKICTALQLTNFWQDSEIDYKKGRIYYPIEDMEKFNVTEKMFELKENNLKLKELVRYNVEKTHSLFVEGKSLIPFLKGRLKYEIKWTIEGGEAVLNKIKKNDFNVFLIRPKLTKIDFLKLLLKAIL